jgi:hypothetical protein
MKRAITKPRSRRRGFVTCRAPRLCLALASVILCPATLACAGKATQPADQSAAASVACAKTRYVLTVKPSTIVANERHSLLLRALAESCGRQTPVRGAHVRLLGYQATTNSRGRCTLEVRLATGRDLIRLYVHRHRVARTAVSAIPLVAQ